MALAIGVHRGVRRDGHFVITESQVPVEGGGVVHNSIIRAKGGLNETRRLGDRWHPEAEEFVLLNGQIRLFTAPVDDPASIDLVTLGEPTSIVIPARVVHTFICDPGTLLVIRYGWPFSEETIIQCRLDLTRFGIPNPEVTQS